ncbi:MAG: methionyl-tRNA formyltransferase [Chloroflexi bacterium]|nr:MAG: methionyl-tRNA formyltransferase [Chloroflexota bacterium]
MGTIAQPIIFFGTEDFSLIALRALIEHNFNVAAVVTKPDTLRGRGNKLTQPAVKLFAQQHDIPVWQPTKMADVRDDIMAIDNPIGVLVSFGKIIPQSIIDLFSPGIINIHPSLLPKYRGPSPIEAAIKNGDAITGVSIMQIQAKMDAGPVYAQQAYDLDGTENSVQLYDTLGAIGATMLIDTLPQIAGNQLLPVEQSENDASYCQLITKADGIIDWSESSNVIERQIRAYQQWPQSRATISDIECIITSARSINPTEHLSAPGDYSILDDTLVIDCDLLPATLSQHIQLLDLDR